MAITKDGKTLYVAAFGSSKIGVFQTSQLENDTFVPDGPTSCASAAAARAAWPSTSALYEISVVRSVLERGQGT